MNIRLASSGDLWCFAYRSIQVAHMTRADVALMLRESQMRNVNRRITGLLLRIDNHFLQYLEGPQAALDHVQTRLRDDARHRELLTFFHEPASKRLFEDWSMAFSDLSGPSLRQGPTNGLLQQVLHDPVPLPGQGSVDDAFHRFWVECAASLPV